LIETIKKKEEKSDFRPNWGELCGFGEP